ncbi:signal peptidase II [Desulfobacula toluolica]|uniref:Lipoprotein signal peptidase n=1 Tax=Desulfobacula toluolica (strain DSM 7467 / Tol2) TaxID=651182 RepID=K0NH22_DESTT|nr:signal peptidase II [Desulfobacula toluolica]CCK80265.1 LspA: signal peptidase II (lipoprotein signal peptidase) [Desulfobacula toluolica Tol2]
MKNIWLRLILVSGGIVVADQVTKYMIKLNLAFYDHIVVIEKFFNLTHILNPGGAFGFFASQSPGIRKFIFLFMSSLVALFVLWFYKRCAANFVFLSYGLALIFGGAIGNLIDRFRYGKVLDFLDFYIGSAHWPAFNIADSAISIGMGILIYHILFNKIPDF